jgi:hypothetical protein
MRQSASGGFSNTTNPAIGEKIGWVWEASAHYMAYCLSGNREAADDAGYFGDALPVWFDAHFLGLEVTDDKRGSYRYGSWPLLLWMDTRFGAGMSGRLWSENLRDGDGSTTELVPECLARLTNRKIPDLFGDWLASTLTFSYFRSPRFAALVARLNLSGGWTAFDTLVLEGTRLTAQSSKPLQPLGFHALRLDSRTIGKRLRLETAIDVASWRMVVITGGKTEILGAGATSAPVTAGTVVGVICCTRGSELPPSGSYSISLL